MFLAEKTVKNYVSEPARQARPGTPHAGRLAQRWLRPSTIITTPMAVRPTSVREIKDLLPGLARQLRGILGAMYSDGCGSQTTVQG